LFTGSKVLFAGCNFSSGTQKQLKNAKKKKKKTKRKDKERKLFGSLLENVKDHLSVS